MRKPPILSDRIEVYQSRGDWLAARTGKSQHRIGASEVAAILGVSPWAGPWDIWTQRQGLKPLIDPARERAFALSAIVTWVQMEPLATSVPGPLSKLAQFLV